MPITMRCPGCQTRFDFADDLDGKRIKCKSCGDIFRVAGDGPPKKARTDDEDDRYGARNRGRKRDDDDDRPRSRRARVDDDDDRPRRRSRDDEDDELPRKKRLNPLLIIAPIGGVVLIAGIVVAIILLSGKKKGGGPGGDTVAAASRTLALDYAEKDCGQLVLPDGGNTFGLLRSGGTGFKKSWSFEPYDLATKKKGSRIDLADVEEPKNWSLSPDGKNLLVMEMRGIGWAGDHWLWRWPVGEPGRADKWFPFNKPEKGAAFDGPALWRAAFVANDKILTLANNRSFFIYQLPGYQATPVVVASAEKEGLGKRWSPPHDQEYRTQWGAAFSADRSKLAVWTGDGFTLVNATDGTEAGAVGGVRALAKNEWANTAGEPNRVQGGPVAFSPDGTKLAAVVQSDFWNKRLLCIWTLADGALVNFMRVPENQWNEAAGIYWWGNNFIVTWGGKSLGEPIGGMVIDVRGDPRPRRQLMPPEYQKYGFSRDGKLWWVASEERTKPATLNVVDSLDPALLDGEDYEQIPELGQEFFLRRLWLEPTGILRQPTREDPPVKKKLIRRPQ
jgi:hypothetical protein